MLRSTCAENGAVRQNEDPLTLALSPGYGGEGMGASRRRERLRAIALHHLPNRRPSNLTPLILPIRFPVEFDMTLKRTITGPAIAMIPSPICRRA